MDGEIRSRPSTPAYRKGWDRIFGKDGKVAFIRKSLQLPVEIFSDEFVDDFIFFSGCFSDKYDFNCLNDDFNEFLSK